ncbi:Scr1 family TA system antitoxin-like transcriptional regulator [Actinoplanes sp. CA-030573]|uniref:Scr1 family TA system antitoxin-like transcriptional regulator n=1 Tax=Actinoplanes sp. CA-030573 TaxID=3239898 RepID=UPI003D8A42F9
MRQAIREARERAQLTQEEVAGQLDWSVSKYRRMESGDVAISVPDLQALFGLYTVDPHETRAIIADARFARSRQSSWWNAPAFTAYLSAAQLVVAQYELDAKSISSLATVTIPPRMRSPEYATALAASTVHRIPVEEFLRHEADRRRRFAARLPHIEVRLLLDESMLHRDPGGRMVLQDQLMELVTFAQGSTVDLRILPFAEAARLGQSTEFEMLELENDHYAVHVGGRPEGAILEPGDAGTYREVFETLLASALSPVESLRLLQGRINELDRW